MIHVFKTAVHVAAIHPMTGYGLLREPSPESDVQIPGELCTRVLLREGLVGTVGGSLHGSDWDAMLSRLREHGWEPLEDDEDGGPVYADDTGDVALYGPSIVEDVTMGAIVEAHAECLAALG